MPPPPAPRSRLAIHLRIFCEPLPDAICVAAVLDLLGSPTS
jgi:hypothetical protein